MSNLEFAWPYCALLIIILLPMWFFNRKTERENSFLMSPMAVALIKISQGTSTSSWPKSINWMMVAMWMLMVLALMRPQYVGDPIEITRDGRNVMLVLDTSESMEAEDMAIGQHHADRLTIAKEVVNEFIDKRHGDRIGLVVFGTEAFLHAPLSFDHPTIKQFLADAQIGFAGPKTAIGDAIGLSVKKLIEEKPADKMMILLTDGQNNTGALSPEQAARIALKYQVKIYIVGIGASRMVVNGFFGPTAVNPSLSLDEAEPELKSIASMTGGKYYRAKDHEALAKIYAEIDKLEPVKSDPVVLIPRKELFYWPLVAVLILMALRACLILWRAFFSRRRQNA